MSRTLFITVEHKRFRLKTSATQMLTLFIDFRDGLLRINPKDEDQVRNFIEFGCKVVDKLLGKGAMEKIAEGKPVNLTKVVSVLNEILSAVNAAFRR